jgi:hypothetical protein
MPNYTFSITQSRADDLLDRGLDAVHSYLEAQGLLVQGVSLRLDPPTVTVNANADPQPFIASIPWPTKRNYTQARAAMKAFMDTASPTNVQVIAALRGAIVELARD